MCHSAVLYIRKKKNFVLIECICCNKMAEGRVGAQNGALASFLVKICICHQQSKEDEQKHNEGSHHHPPALDLCRYVISLLQFFKYKLMQTVRWKQVIDIFSCIFCAAPIGRANGEKWLAEIHIGSTEPSKSHTFVFPVLSFFLVFFKRDHCDKSVKWNLAEVWPRARIQRNY